MHRKKVNYVIYSEKATKKKSNVYSTKFLLFVFSDGNSTTDGLIKPSSWFTTLIFRLKLELLESVIYISFSNLENFGLFKKINLFIFGLHLYIWINKITVLTMRKQKKIIRKFAEFKSLLF